MEHRRIEELKLRAAIAKGNPTILFRTEPCLLSQDPLYNGLYTWHFWICEIPTIEGWSLPSGVFHIRLPLPGCLCHAYSQSPGLQFSVSVAVSLGKTVVFEGRDLLSPTSSPPISRTNLCALFSTCIYMTDVLVSVRQIECLLSVQEENACVHLPEFMNPTSVNNRPGCRRLRDSQGCGIVNNKTKTMLGNTRQSVTLSHT